MTAQISIVIPVYNESASLPGLFNSLKAPLAPLACEVIPVDDGSSDGTWAILERYAREDSRIRPIRFSRNFGQTAAMAAGFDAAKGDIIVCLDADGQNDPADIPLLLEALDKGADVASGWRFRRQDAWLTRRLPSQLANAIISLVTGVPLHDYGCSLKAYRREFIKDVRLYGEMHRFIPAWCAWRGARVVEVQVNHHARALGKSKYGLGRTFKVILDLITAKFFSSYLSKPSYFFGGMGMLAVFLGFWAGVFPIFDKVVTNYWPALRVPFMILSIFLVLLGFQLIVFGLLAEILVRIYYENKNERPYKIIGGGS